MRAVARALLAALACTAACGGGLSGPDGSVSSGCPAATECKGTPFRVPGVPALVQLSAGSWHTCGLTAEGAAWCWGSTRGSGEAGAGSPATLVPGGHQFVSIAAGRFHNCALTADGTAYCWSSGEPGGPNCGAAECTTTPVAVGTRRYRAITAGSQHTCALDLSGAAFCWGFNVYGETGSTRFRESQREPAAVPGGLHFASISADHLYTCALTLEGALYCWGDGLAGQLGPEPPTCSGGGTGGFCSAEPLAVATTSRFLALSAGFTHACALTAEQRAICWGDNGQGQLGDRAFGDVTPRQATTETWAVIEAGGPTTCGTASEGGTYCWGLNLYGLHGSGSSAEISTTPQRVAGGHSFSALSAGGSHMCGLASDGAVYCWGDNTALQLGGR
jgi:alpha-tubulin suppressor-like RCC1 family protein